MATYVILSRVSPGAFSEPAGFRDLAKSVSQRIKKDCPGVTWKASYATMGYFDVVDVVEAEDPKDVEKASLIIRSIGKSSTQTMLAESWEEFLSAL
jgi:uncharacterized protein with GYD domain